MDAKDSKSNAILEVEEPINDVIERMNELGFKVVLSCCGFDFPGQEKRWDYKFHAGSRSGHSDPYIQFFASFDKVVELEKCIAEVAYSENGERTSRWKILFLGLRPDFLIGFLCSGPGGPGETPRWILHCGCMNRICWENAKQERPVEKWRRCWDELRDALSMYTSRYHISVNNTR